MVLRNKGRLEGLLLLHVDDLCLGGQSELFWTKIKELEKRFDFGSFQHGEGEHLLMPLRQEADFGILCDMTGSASRVQAIKVASHVADETSVLPQQVTTARGTLGNSGGLASKLEGT